MNKSLTAIIRKEERGYSALCPEVDVASQGDSIEEAKANLKEAVELFFECASKEEIDDRLSLESYVSALEVDVALSYRILQVARSLQFLNRMASQEFGKEEAMWSCRRDWRVPQSQFPFQITRN